MSWKAAFTSRIRVILFTLSRMFLTKFTKIWQCVVNSGKWFAEYFRITDGSGNYFLEGKICSLVPAPLTYDICNAFESKMFNIWCSYWVKYHFDNRVSVCLDCMFWSSTKKLCVCVCVLTLIEWYSSISSSYKLLTFSSPEVLLIKSFYGRQCEAKLVCGIL